MVSEKRKLIHSLIFPLLFILIIWMIKIGEVVLGGNLSHFGIYPLKLKGLLGIITAPLIHGDFSHLIANTFPLLVLMTGIFYFYRKVAFKVFFLTYIITGIWVWVSARASFHIGASGLVYGFAAFITTSGIIRNNIRLMAISLVVFFLYGSMIWGIFPMERGISWESHLLGMIAGIFLAYYYRKEGTDFIIKKPVFKFDEYYENEFWKIDENDEKPID